MIFDWIEHEINKARASQNDKNAILLHVSREEFNKSMDSWLKSYGTAMGFQAFLIVFGGEMRHYLGYTTCILISDMWAEDFAQAWKRNGGE